MADQKQSKEQQKKEQKKKEESKKPATPTSAGISAGLKLWLFLLVAFWLLGYSIPLSILWGMTGGISAGIIIAWSNIKEEDEAAKNKPQDGQTGGGKRSVWERISALRKRTFSNTSSQKNPKRRGWHRP